MMSFQSLPPELLLEIFSYLPAEDLLDVVPRVCTTWRELARHPSLWEHFVYTEQHGRYVTEAVEFIEKCPMLKHICASFNDFECPGVQDDLVGAVVRNCSDIRSFCVNFGWGFLTLAHVNSLFEAFPNLEYLHITLKSEIAVELVDRLGECKKLKGLTVRGGYCCDDLLKPIVDGCTSLEYLHCDVAYIPERDYLYILEKMRDRLVYLQFTVLQPVSQKVVDVLATFSKLKVLSFTHPAQSGPVDYLPLANIRTLRRLTFFCYPRKVNAFDTLFRALFRRPLPLLENLAITFSVPSDITLLQDICRCYLGLKSLVLRYEHQGCTKDIFEDVGKLERLRMLVYTAGKGMTDEDIGYLARCRSLKHLELESCHQLTDKSIQHLENCKWLEYLSIRGCSLSGRSLDVLPGRLTRLRTLWLNLKDVEDIDVKDLCRKIRSLKILRF